MLWTAAHQVPQSMGFSRQEYWNGLPFPSPEDLPDPGIEPGSPALKADALTSEPPGKPYELLGNSNYYIKTVLSSFIYICWYLPAWHWSQKLKEARTSLHISKSAAQRIWGQNIEGLITVILDLAFFFFSRHDNSTINHFFHPSYNTICSGKFCQWLFRSGELRWLG